MGIPLSLPPPAGGAMTMTLLQRGDSTRGEEPGGLTTGLPTTGEAPQQHQLSPAEPSKHSNCHERTEKPRTVRRAQDYCPRVQVRGENSRGSTLPSAAAKYASSAGKSPKIAERLAAPRRAG